MVKNHFERRSSGQVVKMTVNFFDLVLAVGKHTLNNSM